MSWTTQFCYPKSTPSLLHIYQFLVIPSPFPSSIFEFNTPNNLSLSTTPLGSTSFIKNPFSISTTTGTPSYKPKSTIIYRFCSPMLQELEVWREKYKNSTRRFRAKGQTGFEVCRFVTECSETTKSTSGDIYGCIFKIFITLRIVNDYSNIQHIQNQVRGVQEKINLFFTFFSVSMLSYIFEPAFGFVWWSISSSEND